MFICVVLWLVCVVLWFVEWANIDLFSTGSQMEATVPK